MATLFTTMNIDGRVSIPEEARTSLGLHAGSRFQLTLEGGRMILEPVQVDDLSDLKGILAGGPDLVAELQQERRREDW